MIRRQDTARRRWIFARVQDAGVYLLCVAGSAFVLLPFAWLLRSSFMSLDQIFRFPPEWVPNPWRWENFPEALTTIPFGLYLKNTLFILIPSVVGTVGSSALAAFGFSRLRWRGRDLTFNVLLATLMLPYAITLIPTFLLWARLGLTNTAWPLVLPRWFGGGAFYIFLLRQFFRTIPREYDEAAILDGANPLQVFWHIILPQSRPALAAVAIFSGLNAWNDFLGPLIYLNDSRKFTLALGLADFTGLYSSQWHLLMAATTVIILPVIILFFTSQRLLIQGITLTAKRR